MRAPPSKFANNVYNGGCNARVFVWVHEALLYLGPCGSQRLGIYQSEAV